jgi:hypothetical protein
MMSGDQTTARAPICKPELPPLMVKNAGALSPWECGNWQRRVRSGADESAFEHGRDYSHAFGRSQDFLRNALIGSRLDLFENGTGRFYAVFRFVIVLFIIGGKGGNGETGNYAQNQKSFHFFLHFRELIEFV